MKNVYYMKTYGDSSGLTNQLFTIVTDIFIALNNDKNILIFDNFSYDYQKKINVAISEVIDLEKLNTLLKTSGYNIVLFDKNKIDFKIKYVTYGIQNQVVDLTDVFIRYFYHPPENRFYLPKETQFTSLMGDPFPGKEKTLTIYYSINNHLFKEEYEENREEDIVFDLKNAYYTYYFCWIDTFNKWAFEYLLTNIHFQPFFKTVTNNFLEKIRKENEVSKKRNILHLRVEDDGIENWSKINKMIGDEFKSKIESKYIDAIKKYYCKEEEIVILSYSQKNKVIDFLEKEGYSFYFIDKQLDKGREWNAIIDFHIAFTCNNVFIGIWNPEKLSGSTFSYLISLYTKPEVKKVFIDIDNIEKEGFFTTV